mgnify:CR=1 FL=1
MEEHAWVKEFPVKIEICDRNGILIEMNDKAITSEGDPDLIGSNILDCHPEPARSKLQDILEHEKTNIYTIEKDGVKKLIYQAPWFLNGGFAGIVELSLEVPVEMPHFVRG